MGYDENRISDQIDGGIHAQNQQFIDRLMIPRVMCIGTEVGKKHYPRSAYETGQILVLVNGWYVNPKRPKRSYPYSVDEVLYYPHLFRSMPWYEGRTAAEMPEYVKCMKTPDQVHFPGEVFKVDWMLSHLGFSERGAIVPATDCYQPAREQEYLEYQNSK